MDSALNRRPSTPSRAQSVGPSSPNRDPMEDTDSSGTRKRPRLDSGLRTYRSMSADRLMAASADNERAQTPTTPPSSDRPLSLSTDTANRPPSVNPTANRVTINVREPNGNGSSNPTSALTDDSSTTLRGGGGGSASPSDLPGASSVVSVTSSPLNSPEIEVAEIEDMTDEPGETRWRPVTSAVADAKQLQLNLLQTFPYLDRARDLRGTFTMLMSALEKQDLGSGDLLEQLASWIELYLQATESLSSQWWNMYEAEREFWDELPLLMDALHRRSNTRLGTIGWTNQDTGQMSDPQDHLQDFLVAFTALVLRMASIDEKTLRERTEDDDTTPDLASFKYLNLLYHVMNHAAPYWKSTVDLTKYDPRHAMLAMIKRLLDPPNNGLKCLTQLSKEFFNQSPHSPILLQHFWPPISIVIYMVHFYNQMHDSDLERLQLSSLPSQAFEFFLTIDARLQTLISKQVSALSIETSQHLVTRLSNLLMLVAIADGQLTRKLIAGLCPPAPDLSTDEQSILVEMAWKFGLLKRCVLEGRMEIRVQGVEGMQRELVDVYKKYVQGPPNQPHHPIAQYLSDFMLASKIVEYLVGVESHPQLILRCANIVGFLVVTSRYTETESDAIWNAVMTSQDPRLIDAILHMVEGFFNISPYPILLYLTVKLNEVPLHAFDATMVNYGRNLLENLRRTWKQHPSDQRMDMPPYHLCIRLIRQSAADASLDAQRKQAIHHFAAMELRNVLSYGPSDEDRRTIYEQCISDIANQNKFATGSISAINALLAQNPEEDTRWLAQESNLVTLLVNESAHVIEEAKRSSSPPSRMVHDTLGVRMELLQSAILFASDSISPEVTKQLWDVTVGSKALDDQARNSAWTVLINVLRSTNKRNCFMDQCIKSFLPGLPAHFLVHGCLAFARDVTSYHLRLTMSLPYEEAPKEAVPTDAAPTAAELLWQLALSVPEGTPDLEQKAIAMLVALYLDSPEAHQRSRTANDAVHIGLVERCIRQLISAASKLISFSDGTSSGEDEPMIIIASEDEIQDQRLSFARSLMILQEFVRGVRTRPMYSPQSQIQSQLPHDFHEIKGTPIKILYQSFSGGSSTDIRTIEVGDLERIEDLSRRLKSLTGYANFTPIAGGRKLDFSSMAGETLKDLKFHQKGLLLIRKAVDIESIPDLILTSGLRPVELEILAHFSELYKLLDMEERLARQVYEFLNHFPPHQTITTLVCSSDSPPELAFPPASPFKILYSIYALRRCLLHQSQNGTATQNLMCHSVCALTETLTRVNLNVGTLGADVDITVASALVDCLLAFLKEPVLGEGGTTLYSDPRALVDRLQSFITEALTVDNNTEAKKLVADCFTTLLEASLHSEVFWSSFKEADELSHLFRRLLLEEPNVELRQGLAKTIEVKCSTLSADCTASSNGFTSYFWDQIVTLIPHSLAFRSNSQQFFDAATIIFRSVDQRRQQELDIAKYAQNWITLLLEHHHNEYVGRDDIDWIVFGISRLLLHCLQLAKSSGKPLRTPDNLMQALFRAHLFPELSRPLGGTPISIRVPNLHTNSRAELYSIILALSNDANNYKDLLMLARDLLPQDERSHAWSWGFAQIVEDFTYDPNWSFERSKSIRSPTGYPGLRNLSNTCYMNSLFTQLFMNVEFRGFILRSNLADACNSQKLLAETQRLFAYLQEIMLKSVDPQGIVDSLVTYDNQLIDVGVQMDVDEFYNLLFDRWESQILDDVEKETFRGFYGGQIVQQIKSKECPHISERLEPFSAIQCDISGKTNLMESLDAYVSGEVMAGDNKYSCTSCGCYVEAVKRACLKDIPANLIFHLKRFDYDVMTGLRSKINDRFEFPRDIDMSPYHVDYLKNPEDPASADLFELVGVLVHSGTAESGHYYSYIQERPPASTGRKTWVEFNDSDVSRFDPSNIEDQCFGGWGESTLYNTRYLKSWNAYMLFYQRVDPQKSGLEQSLTNLDKAPAKCKIPTELETRIALNNEAFLRQYCLFDPAHANFAKNLLEQLRLVNKGTCSVDHAMEKEAIWIALDQLDRIICRTKDCPQFDKMLASLTRVIGACSHCCRLALEWVINTDFALHHILIKCPSTKARKDFSGMIITALQYLRRNEPQWYGFDETDDSESDSSETSMRRYGGIFPNILARLKDLWADLHMQNRGWDDYFGLLVEMANIGKPESHTILRAGFLKSCLETLTIEHPNTRSHKPKSLHYQHYIRMLEKGRKVPLGKLVELVSSLLARIDLRPPPLEILSEDRPFNLDRLPLTSEEENLIRLGADAPRPKNICVFLEKILNNGSNPQAAKKIIQVMVLAEPEFKMFSAIKNTIQLGISVDPASMAAPYLRAALTFCECSPSTSSIEQLIRFIAGEIETIGLTGGSDHLDFFVQARRLRSLRSDKPPELFNRVVLRFVHVWAPPLLVYWEESVRLGTVELLRILLFSHDLSMLDDEEAADEIETSAKQLCAACVQRCELAVQQTKPAEGKRNFEQMIDVVRFCLKTYYGEEDENVVERIETALGNFEALTVSDVDDAGSGVYDTSGHAPSYSQAVDAWNNSADGFVSDSDSEIFGPSP